MPAFTIQDVSRRSGLSEPTLRYYEQVGLVGPIDRDERSGHRRYGTEDLHTLEALACLRVTGVGIEYMRTYKANLSRRQTAEGGSAICCCATRSASRPRSSPSKRGWATCVRRRRYGTPATAGTPADAEAIHGLRRCRHCPTRSRLTGKRRATTGPKRPPRRQLKRVKYPIRTGAPPGT